MLERIRARRNELAALIKEARLVYADLEVQRDQAIRALAELQRQLDGMAGAKQELDALLSSADDPPQSDTATPLASIMPGACAEPLATAAGAPLPAPDQAGR
jgi:ABC-type transporter Mla subunit MlaD